MVRYADDIVIGFDKRYRCPALPYSHAAQTEEVRTHGSPGENPSDGVRPLRCRKPCHQGKGKPETFNFLGFTHISGKDRSGRFMLIRKTRRDQDDGNSESHQRRSAKALALLNPRTGKMAQESGSGIPELPLSAGQLPHHAEVQDTRNRPLAPGAQARSQKDDTTWTKQTNWQPYGYQGFGFFIHGLWSGSPPDT